MSYKFRLCKEQIFLKFLKSKNHIINILGRKITLQSNVEVMHIAHFKATVPLARSKALHLKKPLGSYLLYFLNIIPQCSFLL